MRLSIFALLCVSAVLSGCSKADRAAPVSPALPPADRVASTPPEDLESLYRQAESFLAWNTEDKVFHEGARPRWLKQSSAFWYVADTREGTRYLRVEPNSQITPLFDHAKVAEALNIPLDKMELEGLSFDEESGAISFYLTEQKWSCDADLRCKKENEAPSTLPKGAVASPDGKWIAYVKEDFNLYLRGLDQGDSKGRERRLTKDGSEKYRYGIGLPSARSMVRAQDPKKRGWTQIRWAKDSSKLVVPLVDCREAGEFALVQSVPEKQMRPMIYTYNYGLPGEDNLCSSLPVVFNAKTRKRMDAKVDPAPIRYYGFGVGYRWRDDNSSIDYFEVGRGHREAWLRRLDSKTGVVRNVLTERSETMVDWGMTELEYLDKSSELIFASERDGWNHLYLLDGENGAVKRQITKGEFVVREIVYVDEDKRQIYFMAGGREAGRDPYLKHLYRVGIDDSKISLLTPEDADHRVYLSPDAKYFVDNYSRADLPGVAVLRSAEDGKVLREIERTDYEDLKKMGFTMPEPFRAKARDGKTDVYGVVLRPANFDPNKVYPIVENIYTGPHSFTVPKRFSAYRDSGHAIAQLGFIVVLVDGLGTGKRSKAFHNFSHKNLGDGGLEDHIAAIKQMAARYPYMDTSRVGVYGFSAGGYDSARALLTHPEFYKVAVSASGNHELRIDKASWVESWMGSELGEHYDEHSNITLAHKLRGKLLLAHGELDENVHPASTLKLVDALIKANADFDFLIMPNKHHYLGDHPYFIRKRWDFFVEHLQSRAPLSSYKIEKPEE